VSIQPAENGSLTAFIRNPEFNSFRRRVYRVDVDGTKVSLTNTQKAGDSIVGTYDPALDRLLLPTMDSHPPLDFTRRKDGDAAGFFARAPGGAPCGCRKPDASEDGWPTASLGDVGVAGGRMAGVVEKMVTALWQGDRRHT